MSELSIKARISLADQYKASGDHALAAKVLHEGLNLEPENLELMQYLATLYMQGKNYGLVYHLMKRAKEINPADPTFDHNLGLAVMNMAPIANKEANLDEAERLLRKALQKYPFWQSHSGLAQIALSRGEWDTCISHAQKALELAGESPDTTIWQTMGFAHLAKGNFAAGWEAIEKHIGGEMRRPKPVHGEPYWDGSTSIEDPDSNLGIPRKTRLFVQGEQGIGDEISFASVIPDASREMDLVLECDRRLEGLFKRSFPDVEVHGTRTSVRDPIQRDWRGQFDAMCLSGTLSRYYRRKKSDFPRSGFLKADPERRIQWRALLDTLPGKKIGLAWNGGVPMNFRGRRSMRLDDLKYLLKTPGVTWISLEYKDPTGEIAEFLTKHPEISIKHWPRAAEADDYDETAALVSELDGVVSVCTAVVHLCGALGKKCHVLVPKVPRWFYGIEGREHAWYDSLILHRQKKEWPLDEVRRELCDELFPQAVAA